MWTVTNKAGEQLLITIDEVLHDSAHELGVDPGLVKDGVEAHLQKLLAEQIEMLGEGFRLVRREFPTRDRAGRHHGPRRGRTRRRGRDQAPGRDRRGRAADPLPGAAQPRSAAGTGARVFAAQEIKPQARTLAEDRGIDCVVLDYDALRGIDNLDDRLF